MSRRKHTEEVSIEVSPELQASVEEALEDAPPVSAKDADGLLRSLCKLNPKDEGDAVEIDVVLSQLAKLP